uniref:Pentapeptide repeat-containing protein n=1 Tax=candidate division WOR-3 bacterium TaxID=2052148 RepID=A0A7C3YZ17_UNCW3
MPILERRNLLGNADFSWAQFSGNTDFAFARFLKKTDFRSSRVNLLDFTSCEIFSFLRLREIQQIEGNSDPPIILLRDLRFWENGHILLEDFVPSGISFLHTNFHIVHPRIYLIRMDWGKEKIILDDIFKRKIKAEKEEERSKWEIVYKPIEEMSEEKKVEEIERCYRQIRLAYEAMGEYPDAGDFYLQEMRIREKRLKGIIKILHWLYGWVSKYGESPARAFCWLIGIWLGSAFLYLFTGFNFSGYNVLYLPKFAISKIRILLAVSFAFINLIPGYFRFIIQPQTNPLLTTIISIIEGFLGIIVLTLFLLAIRRRFKR